VGAHLLRGHGELDRLLQGVGGRPHHRVRRVRPVPEGQEANLLHGSTNCGLGSGIPQVPTGEAGPTTRGACGGGCRGTAGSPPPSRTTTPPPPSPPTRARTSPRPPPPSTGSGPTARGTPPTPAPATAR